MSLTYTQALLRTRNRDAYSVREVREAAVFVLGAMDASDEDVSDAAHALAYCDTSGFVVAVEGASLLGAIERGEDVEPIHF